MARIVQYFDLSKQDFPVTNAILKRSITIFRQLFLPMQGRLRTLRLLRPLKPPSQKNACKDMLKMEKKKKENGSGAKNGKRKHCLLIHK